MGNFIAKTLGGLDKQYYFRQLFFGMTLSALHVFIIINHSENFTAAENIYAFLYAAISAFLYPYSRFVYESIIGFIMGDSVYAINALFLLIVKLLTMTICWSFAFIIAPLGLIYLYFYHSRS